MDSLRELDITSDEIKKIGEALKDKEFRKLLVDYIQEIQDPENKRQYEKEMIELEKQRGFDITFIHPSPGWVIKTSADGSKKTFVNVCASELIEKPSSTPALEKGLRGLQWSVPHSPSPPRQDVDNKGARCTVFDVVFHPDSLHLAQRNEPFRNMVNKVACQAVEDNYDVKLDRNNLKFPKIQYKGTCNPIVIRKRSTEPKPDLSAEEQAFLDKLYSEVSQQPEQPKNKKKGRKSPSTETDSPYTTPKYQIKHRSHIEMEDFTYDKECKMNAAIPKELIVVVNLPLLKSSGDIDLDVEEKTLQLVSEKPAKYKLFLTLPYAVSEDHAKAIFDKDLKVLVVTLPVKRRHVDRRKEDSGVESDNGSVTCSSPSEEQSGKLIAEISTTSCDTKPQTEETHCLREDPFLDPEIHYNFPEYAAHCLGHTITFTLNVKNVDNFSVQKQLTPTTFTVKFTTVSSGFYPVHYAFHANFPELSLDHQFFTVEVWDNNVVVQAAIDANSAKSVTYFCGINENESLKNELEINIINDDLNDVESSPSSDEVSKLTKKDKKRVKLAAKKAGQTQARNSLEKQVDGELKNAKDGFVRSSKAVDILFSESSGDELSCSSPSKSRGILKHFARNVPRSVSESSLDDYVCASSVENNCFTSLDSVIPEEGEVGSSLKKTVRFNDVVSRQLYRSNSSILGQRKKNQRKAKARKRAHERRCSESEISESDEKKDNLEYEIHRNKEEEKSKNEHADIFQLDM